MCECVCVCVEGVYIDRSSGISFKFSTHRKTFVYNKLINYFSKLGTNFQDYIFVLWHIRRKDRLINMYQHLKSTSISTKDDPQCG